MRIEELIGQRIREIREISSVTQEQLGQKVGELLGRDWPRQTVSAAEKGGRAFTAVELLAIARALETSVGRLFSPSISMSDIELPGGVTVHRNSLIDHGLPNQAMQRAFEQADKALEDVRRVLDASAVSASALADYAITGHGALARAHESMAITARLIADALQSQLSDQAPGSESIDQ